MIAEYNDVKADDVEFVIKKNSDGKIICGTRIKE